jgi:hypothetical protein
MDPARGTRLGFVSRSDILEAGRERMLEEFERERFIHLLRRRSRPARSMVKMMSKELR